MSEATTPTRSRWRPRRQPRRKAPEELTPSGPPKRVGHKGAGLLAPGNTVAAFNAALAVGVDMIEFDVLPRGGGGGRPGRRSRAPVGSRGGGGRPGRRSRAPVGSRGGGGELLMAHDLEDARRPDVLTLAQGLEHLAGPRFAGIELDVDLKLPGYELQVLAALREHGLLERSLISTTHVNSLRAIRRAAPNVRLGLSVPQLRRDPFAGGPLQPFAPLMLRYGRAIVPGGAARALRAHVCDAMMVHWRLVTPRLIRAVAAQGGELYVWTVDNLEGVEQLYDLGVTGIISNDPRLFALAESVRLPADEHHQ